MLYLFYDKNSKAKQKSRKISASEKEKRRQMQTHTNRQNTSYARIKALSLEVNADILVAFLMSVLRELENLGPWKLTENFLTFVLTTTTTTNFYL